MAAAKLSNASLILRLAIIGAVMAGIVILFADAGGWLTPNTLTPRQLINTFEQINGVHPGFRRNHAKGVCVSGYFESNGNGVTLSKASVFTAGRLPVIGRFSLGGGMPYAADDAQAVRGFGIRFELPEGEEWRTAMINLPAFPVKTPEAFHELMLASAPDHATGKPDAAKMKAFLSGHPESAKALQLIGSQPKSSGFENSSFNSENAFRFINSRGDVAYARWSLAPLQSVEPVKDGGARETGTNYLFDALIVSIHRHPLQWRLVLTVAAAEDPTDDATMPWLASRRQVDVGTLTIDHVESDDTSSTRDINFDPLILPDGIAASEDPLLSARSAAYSQSFTRREGEPKEASAISAAETQK
jgi:catalase